MGRTIYLASDIFSLPPSFIVSQVFSDSLQGLRTWDFFSSKRHEPKEHEEIFTSSVKNNCVKNIVCETIVPPKV